MLIRELASPTWDREEELIKMDPRLVIVHMSCFDGGQRGTNGYHRLSAFLRRMAEATECSFLVYTRSPDSLDSPSVQSAWRDARAALDGLRSALGHRVRVYEIPPQRGFFQDPQTGFEMKTLVREVLQSQVSRGAERYSA